MAARSGAAACSRAAFAMNGGELCKLEGAIPYPPECNFETGDTSFEGDDLTKVTTLDRGWDIGATSLCGQGNS